MVASLLSVLAAATFTVQQPLVTPPSRLPLPRPAASAQRAVAQSNRIASGTLSRGVLTLALDVVESAWKPEGDNDPEVPVFAFAEVGKTPTVPGPLVRVPRGTEVRLTVRNRVDAALYIGGLRPGAGASLDTFTLARGETRQLRYRLDTPGSYFYWGSFAGTRFVNRLWKDSQLNGAIIVEAPGESAANDHVFLMTEWFHPYPDRPFESVTVINGKAWPYTERLTLGQGDSTRFRLLNPMALNHPMHLHGFYYRVLSRGNWTKDGPIAPALQPLLNTDIVPPGGTMTLVFAPTTPGNWLFHCHLAPHMDESVTLVGSPRDSASLGGPASVHAAHGSGTDHRMHGLVIGLRVTPKPGYVAYADPPDARAIRLIAQKRPGALLDGAATAYGFVVQKGDSVPPKDSVVVPGPVLELERGKPVRITVVNNLHEPTGIHWHGLEIESFPDGVAHWSGMGDRIFPPVAAGGSFVAAFTPPRAGTFPYHSHLNERHQIQSGMYGAIIVTDKPRDLAHDHLIVAGGGGPAVYWKMESPYALVNGLRTPTPLRLTAGEVHRLRIVSIHPDWRITFTLRSDSATARWRAIAKDGADLPPAQATVRMAQVEMGPGETADFEFTPPAPGMWTLDIRTAQSSGWQITLPIVAVAPGTSPRK